VICQLLIQEVQIHVPSWELAILTYIRGFSQSPPPPPDKFRLCASNYATVDATQIPPSSSVTWNTTVVQHRIWFLTMSLSKYVNLIRNYITIR
jgi:hypothetical protein